MSTTYPFVEANSFTATGAAGRRLDLIVMHTMELPEKPDTAEGCAHYFATVTEPKVSAHYCVDANSIVQCVRDLDVAYAAPGANHNGIQIELAGTSAQNSQQWADDFSKQMLNRAAALVREKCLEHNIPIVFVSSADLRQGKRGITTHKTVNDAFHKSTHTDPGPWFPLGQLITLANLGAVTAPQPEEDMPLNDADLLRIADSVNKVLDPRFDAVDTAIADLAKRLARLEHPSAKAA